MEFCQVIDFHTKLQRAFPNTHIEWHETTNDHKYSNNVLFEPKNIDKTVEYITQRMQGAETIHLTYHSDYVYFTAE